MQSTEETKYGMNRSMKHGECTFVSGSCRNFLPCSRASVEGYVIDVIPFHHV